MSVRIPLSVGLRSKRKKILEKLTPKSQDAYDRTRAIRECTDLQIKRLNIKVRGLSKCKLNTNTAYRIAPFPALTSDCFKGHSRILQAFFSDAIRQTALDNISVDKARRAVPL